MLECFCKKDTQQTKRKEKSVIQKKIQSIPTNQTNKEIEEFIEGYYITIKEGE
jgi:hypothetical protein